MKLLICDKESVRLNTAVYTVYFRKNMYAGGDSQMNGDMPHDGGHGGGGHAVGEELKKTGRYETIITSTAKKLFSFIGRDCDIEHFI